ncbi:MAG TPA: glycosyltransferase [Flavipsychrobacter sp.]|nr:glycosyltransferase [Flavipsychrobacter sp.]
MRKILWLSHEVDLGGANKCLAEQIHILHDAGYHVEVIVLRDAIFADHVRSYTKGIHEIYFYAWVLDIGKKISQFRFWKRVFRNSIAVWKIYRLILKVKPDYVATNTMTIPPAAIAAKLAGTPHVWFIHEFGEEDHGYQMFCGLQRGARLVNWLSAKVVFNSEAVRKKFAAFIEPQKQFIAHNPVVIPENETGSVNDSVKTVLTTVECLILGQIAPSKNQLEALQAILLLKENGITANLTIAGNVVNDGYEETLKQFIQNNGLSQQVNLLGYTDNPFALLRQTDVYLMCSRMEAFGRVSVEALKFGVPVIAADSGGSPEIIENEVNGYLYETGNVKQLAEKIKQFSASRHQFDSSAIAANANMKFNSVNTREQLIRIFA